MTTNLERIDGAGELPEQWDIQASDYYQRRAFLSHCQQYNPCRQRYYLLLSQGEILAGAVVYTLRIDLLTYLGIKSPLTMQVVGVPCSVASSGLLGSVVWHGELLRRVFTCERGLVACLNLDALPADVPAAVGRTWPDIVLHNRFSSLPAYAASLCSSYRRRLRQIQRDARTFSICTGTCKSFDEQMHNMYLEVFMRSEGKLEKLECAFFRNLPESFCLTQYAAEGALRGWTITHGDGERFSFFLGGQDYRYDPKRLYRVQLMTVLQQGIASGTKQIHFGQSAEIPKMRMGGIPQEKIMLGYHSRPISRWMLGASMGMLSYRRYFPPTHVFKETAG